jgi:transglutaminase-like putative cysteine protease
VKLLVQAALDYALAEPCDVMLQLEAAALPDQRIVETQIDLPNTEHFARIPGHDRIGERIWVRLGGELSLRYHAVVEITRDLPALTSLAATHPHELPGETIEYLMPSRYCPSDLFGNFVEAEFGGLAGGALVQAIRDWIETNFSYVPGSSTSETTALDSYVRREGICRDYAHVLIALVRAAGMPARIASVFALGVTPPDFHAVAQVYVGGEWHLVDATGMADPGATAIIGVGRDAADVSFLMAYGHAELLALSVAVTALS